MKSGSLDKRCSEITNYIHGVYPMLSDSIKELSTPLGTLSANLQNNC